MQKGLLIRKDGKIVAKEVFSGNVDHGIQLRRFTLSGKNLEFQEFESDTDPEFQNAELEAEMEL